MSPAIVASFFTAHDARPHSSPTADGEVRGSVQWSHERCALDAILPHGAIWSLSQIDWFVGTWRRHLVSKSSISEMKRSLLHFSSWASDSFGLECLCSWLHMAIRAHDIGVAIQILELLEYTELVRDTTLTNCDEPPTILALRSVELVRVVSGMRHHSNRHVARVACRVTSIMENRQV